MEFWFFPDDFAAARLMILAAWTLAQSGAPDFSSAAGVTGSTCSGCGAIADSFCVGAVAAGDTGFAFGAAFALGLVAGLGSVDGVSSVLGFTAAFAGAFFLAAGLSDPLASAAGLATFFAAGLLDALAFCAADATIALAAAAALFLAAGFLGAAVAGALSDFKLSGFRVSGFTSSGVVMDKTPCYWRLLEPGLPSSRATNAGKKTSLTKSGFCCR